MLDDSVTRRHWARRHSSLRWSVQSASSTRPLRRLQATLRLWRRRRRCLQTSSIHSRKQSWRFAHLAKRLTSAAIWALFGSIVFSSACCVTAPCKWSYYYYGNLWVSYFYRSWQFTGSWYFFGGKLPDILFSSLENIAYIGFPEFLILCPLMSRPHFLLTFHSLFVIWNWCAVH